MYGSIVTCTGTIANLVQKIHNFAQIVWFFYEKLLKIHSIYVNFIPHRSLYNSLQEKEAEKLGIPDQAKAVTK